MGRAVAVEATVGITTLLNGAETPIDLTCAFKLGLEEKKVGFSCCQVSRRLFEVEADEGVGRDAASDASTPLACRLTFSVESPAVKCLCSSSRRELLTPDVKEEIKKSPDGIPKDVLTATIKLSLTDANELSFKG